MASVIETGFAKIVANFDQLIKSILGIGAEYSPSNPELTPDAMQKKSSVCKAAIETVTIALFAFRSAVKAREIAFNSLGSLSTRILNTLRVSGNSEESVAIAQTYVRRINGRRAKEKRTETEKQADLEAGIQYREISSSQMSFDSRLENFGMLVKIVSGVPSYKPNEAELKLETLNALLSSLTVKNETVRTASSALFKARAHRNDMIYNEATGLVDMALDAKTYLKAAFGPASPQYKEVSGLNFKRVSKN
jgi:hypothetical protein